MGVVFGDLHRVLVEREALKHCQPKVVCNSFSLYENVTQLFHIWSVDLFLIKDKANGLFVIWQCSNFSCLGLLTFEVQIRRVPWNYFSCRDVHEPEPDERVAPAVRVHHEPR